MATPVIDNKVDNDGNEKEKEQESASCHLRKQFSLTQWYYQCLWTQQYLYWQSLLSSQQHIPGQSPPRIPPLQYPLPPNPFTVPPIPYGGALPPENRQQQPHVQVRVINGFETRIASTWRRLLAELIDLLLVALILKWYIPDIDFRIPESIFLGTDAILNMDDDELEEVGWTVLVFLLSVTTQRVLHLIMETLGNHYVSCTPGKYIMGLRIYRCTRVQYTRTDPGSTIKIQPGTRLGIWQSFLRALFKFVSNMFCPLIIFFVVLDRGRTQYDRAFKCIIVNKRQLHRPLY